jgi:large subunit ribosomal protein L29
MAQEKINFAEMADTDLASNLASMSTEYAQMKFDHTVRGMANPMELREIRRNIARVNTEMRRRELATFSPGQLELRSKIRARRSR